MTAFYSTFLAIVVAAMPLYLVRFSLADIPTNLFEIAVFGLVAIGLMLPPVRHTWRQAETNLPRSTMVLIGLFVLAAFVSAYLSPVPRDSFGIFKSWIIVPLLLAWMVYVTPEIRNSKFEIRNWLITSGVIVSLLSLTQFRWGERLAGIYDVPNSLALYLSPLIVLAVGQWFSPPPPAGGQRGREGIFLVAAVMMFLALLLTQSVAGIVAVLFGVTVVVIKRKSESTKEKQNPMHSTQNLRFVFSVLFGLCVLIFVFLSQTGRFAYLSTPLTSNTPNSISVRLQLWDISWDLIKENPLLGIGLGQFEPAYQQKLHERFQEFENCRIENCTQPLAEFVYRDPHNWVLSFWLNTGLLGLLSFTTLHVLAMKQLPAGRSLGEGWNNVTIALITLLLFGLVDTMYWKNDLSALHWVLLALLLKYQTWAPEHP